MEWYIILAVIAVGFIAGFINTIAGSGSLLSLPFLMFLGLPANVANGTNRIAILFQNIVAVKSFHNKKVLNFKQGIWLAIPAIVGSLIGAQFAVNINDEIMKKAIGGLLIIMFFFILLKPSDWINGKAGTVGVKPNILQIVIFFCIGVYGGFIQAGVGLFLLGGLVLSAGFDLVRANAIKVLIILCYTPFALGIYIYNNQIDYKWGLILAAGNMLGAFIATKFAVNWGPKYIRIILLVILFFASLKLIGVDEYIF